MLIFLSLSLAARRHTKVVIATTHCWEWREAKRREESVTEICFSLCSSSIVFFGQLKTTSVLIADGLSVCPRLVFFFVLFLSFSLLFDAI